jgi:hypothetical protein
LATKYLTQILRTQCQFDIQIVKEQ